MERKEGKEKERRRRRRITCLLRLHIICLLRYIYHNNITQSHLVVPVEIVERYLLFGRRTKRFAHYLIIVITEFIYLFIYLLI